MIAGFIYRPIWLKFGLKVPWPNTKIGFSQFFEFLILAAKIIFRNFYRRNFVFRISQKLIVPSKWNFDTRYLIEFLQIWDKVFDSTVSRFLFTVNRKFFIFYRKLKKNGAVEFFYTLHVLSNMTKENFHFPRLVCTFARFLCTAQRKRKNGEKLRKIVKKWHFSLSARSKLGSKKSNGVSNIRYLTNIQHIQKF